MSDESFKFIDYLPEYAPEVNLEDYALPPGVAQKYAETLCKHLYYMRSAAHIIGLPKYYAERHDLSKWDKEEFEPYARWFVLKEAREEFEVAWKRHYTCNPHHWNFWVESDGTPNTMGNLSLLEMVADWMGSSRAYTGSWDMTKWLTDNLPTMNLSSASKVELLKILQHLGYDEFTLDYIGSKLER